MLFLSFRILRTNNKNRILIEQTMKTSQVWLKTQGKERAIKPKPVCTIFLCHSGCHLNFLPHDLINSRNKISPTVIMKILNKDKII
ncbi:MAG: hypothetical protein ACKOAD_04315 [Gammaproteobacteria bacterium]